MEAIKLAQDRYRQLALINMVMKIWITEKAGKKLTKPLLVAKKDSDPCRSEFFISFLRKGAGANLEYIHNLCFILKTALQKSSRKYNCNVTMTVTEFIHTLI